MQQISLIHDLLLAFMQSKGKYSPLANTGDRGWVDRLKL
jgi:hypothetical protein